MKHIVKYLIILLTLGNVGCWDLQESYHYEPSNANPYLNLTAWEFIEARIDTFSLFKEAIEYVDENEPGFKDIYQQTTAKKTFLFLNNNAFRASSNSVFSNNGGVTNVRQIPYTTVRDILLYHIVYGYYHSLDVSGSLGFEPVYVITHLHSQNSFMTMRIQDASSRTTYSRLYVNENNGSSRAYYAVTSNLIATNGVIHVFSNQLVYIP